MKFLVLAATLAATASVDALLTNCDNIDFIRLAAIQLEGGRCTTETGFDFLRPVSPDTSFEAFCANPRCQAAWSKISALATKECLVENVNVKGEVLDKLKGVCDVPVIPPCANADAINGVLRGSSVARCADQAGFSFTVPVANNASLTSFCFNPYCAVRGDLNKLMPEECLINGFNMKKEVLDKVAVGCAAVTTAPPKQDCPSN